MKLVSSVIVGPSLTAIITRLLLFWTEIAETIQRPESRSYSTPGSVGSTPVGQHRAPRRSNRRRPGHRGSGSPLVEDPEAPVDVDQDLVGPTAPIESGGTKPDRRCPRPGTRSLTRATTWARSPSGRSAAAAGQGPRPSAAGSPRRALASPSPSAHRRTRRRLAAARRPGLAFRLGLLAALFGLRLLLALRGLGLLPALLGLSLSRRSVPRGLTLAGLDSLSGRDLGGARQDRRVTIDEPLARDDAGDAACHARGSGPWLPLCCLGPVPVVVPDQNHSHDHQHEHAEAPQGGCDASSARESRWPPGRSNRRRRLLPLPAASGESTDCSGRRRYGRKVTVGATVTLPFRTRRRAVLPVGVSWKVTGPATARLFALRLRSPFPLIVTMPGFEVVAVIEPCPLAVSADPAEREAIVRDEDGREIEADIVLSGEGRPTPHPRGCRRGSARCRRAPRRCRSWALRSR